MTTMFFIYLLSNGFFYIPLLDPEDSNRAEEGVEPLSPSLEDFFDPLSPSLEVSKTVPTPLDKLLR
jgi:hypothetical protein